MFTRRGTAVRVPAVFDWHAQDASREDQASQKLSPERIGSDSGDSSLSSSQSWPKGQLILLGHGSSNPNCHRPRVSHPAGWPATLFKQCLAALSRFWTVIGH